MHTYTTEQGDTWDLIAFRVYGNELLIPPLLEANPLHRATVVFASGQVLAVPARPKSGAGTRDVPPWRKQP